MKMWNHKLGTVAIALVAMTGSLFASEGWKTDYDAALKQAKADNHYVLIDFSGSDWCGWCIRLDKEVFSKDAFKTYAAGNLELLMLDFPQGKSQSDALKAQNKKLQGKYKVRGFPTVILLNPDGKVAGRTGYQAGGPEAYIEHIKKMIAEDKEKAAKK